jgi:peptide/nickel transport system substrate-binding protein
VSGISRPIDRSDIEMVLTLREDIRFEDGSLLTADDVVFSIRRITDPAFKSPQLSQFDSVASAEPIGTNQVLLTTKRPYPVLLAQLAKLSIVPRTAVEKLGNDGFNQHPVGSGPYRLVNFSRGVKVELAANPNYWRGPPSLPPCRDASGTQRGDPRRRRTHRSR